MPTHDLLIRQLRKSGIDPDALPAEAEADRWLGFLEKINRTYSELDRERYVLDRSAAVSSAEMRVLHDELRRERDRLEKNVAERTASLSESETRFRLIVNHLPAGAVLFRDGRVTFNDAAAAIIGYSQQEISTVEAWFETLYGSRASHVRASFERMRVRKFPRAVKARIKRKDGQVRLVEFTQYSDSAGDVGLMIDVTDRQRVYDELCESLHYSRSLINSSIDMIISVDNNRKIVEFNPAAEKAFGYTREEMIGRSVSRLYIDPEQGEEVYRITRINGNWSGEILNRRKNGELFCSLLSASLITSADGQKMGIVGISRDISDKKKAEERIRYLAHYDELTGLANRTQFRQAVISAMESARARKSAFALFIVDLDRFKNINDTLGHQVGDEVIKAIGIRMRDTLDRCELVARIDGDEFAVLVADAVEPSQVADVARAVLSLVSLPVNSQSSELRLSASIGISRFPEDARDADDLVKNADVAMQRAKAQGRNNFQLYSASMNSHSLERLLLESSLSRALSAGEFVLHYQPKLDMLSRRITGVEALVRWQHPTLGLLPPAQFIPMAEESGMIGTLGEWVLETACAQASAWEKMGGQGLSVAVNLSAWQLSNVDLSAMLKRVLADAQLRPDLLELEITESMIMTDPEQTVATLLELRKIGVRLSIDDFGTGYSSLAYLKKFPIDAIKIDRSFIVDIPHDGDDIAIAKAILSMARNLKLTVIAEGVETPEQLAFLQDNHCHVAQGFLISRPIPGDEVMQYLREPLPIESIYSAPTMSAVAGSD